MANSFQKPQTEYGYCTENSSLSWGIFWPKTKEKTRKDAVSVWPPQGLERETEGGWRDGVFTPDIVHFLNTHHGWKLGGAHP